MLCQNCQKRVANVHFTQVINNHRVEMYLCDKCAGEKGQISVESTLNIHDFFTGLMGCTHPVGFVQPASQEAVCEVCGLSYEEFQRTGKLGCANCYTLYKEKLKPVLRRLHGSIQHTGKTPEKMFTAMNNSREVEKLREDLNVAIQNEEYEKAAEIRDKIRVLEK